MPTSAGAGPDRIVPPDVGESAARLLKLLAEPTRRRIFGALMAGETCNCELVESLGLAENLVSHHIKQLRLAGFVRERRDLVDARWVHYGLDQAVLATAWASLSAFLDPARVGLREPICPRPPQSSPAGTRGCERGACRRARADLGAACGDPDR
jgi:DNA-binding transcriptional ArsR family regulator